MPLLAEHLESGLDSLGV
ncbi:MAG: hypothetical protein ACE360_09560 [Hyphomicrobiales bacterium]